MVQRLLVEPLSSLNIALPGEPQSGYGKSLKCKKSLGNLLEAPGSNRYSEILDWAEVSEYRLFLRNISQLVSDEMEVEESAPWWGVDAFPSNKASSLCLLMLLWVVAVHIFDCLSSLKQVYTMRTPPPLYFNVLSFPKKPATVISRTRHLRSRVF